MKRVITIAARLAKRAETSPRSMVLATREPAPMPTVNIATNRLATAASACSTSRVKGGKTVSMRTPTNQNQEMPMIA